MRVWILVLAVAWGHAHAGILPEKEREELIAVVLKNFWGKAKLSSGQFAQPVSEEERTRVPIPTKLFGEVTQATSRILTSICGRSRGTLSGLSRSKKEKRDG